MNNDELHYVGCLPAMILIGYVFIKFMYLIVQNGYSTVDSVSSGVVDSAILAEEHTRHVKSGFITFSYPICVQKITLYELRKPWKVLERLHSHTTSKII